MARFQYLEVEAVSFLWERAKGYYWTDEAAVVTDLIFGKTSPPYLIPAKGETITAAVLKGNEKLFMEFAALEPSKDGVLEFAGRYGMLTQGEVFVKLPGRPRRTANAESLSFWVEEIHRMKLAFSVWEAIQDNDTGFFRKIISAPGNKWFQYRQPEREDILPTVFIRRDNDPEAFRQAERGNALTRGKLLLSHLINEKLDIYNMDYPTHLAAAPQAFLDDTGMMGSYLKPSTLLAAMWVQLLRAATGEAKYKRCQSCGRWEDASNLQKNWRYHPECASREKQRRYRERLKGVQDGHDQETRR